MRNPFNVLAEGLIVKKDRDNKTAIELFLAGIRVMVAKVAVVDLLKLDRT